MSLRSEMALYYHYFKLFTVGGGENDSNWYQVIREEIVVDGKSQTPTTTTNALVEYNILPEILAGIGYRALYYLLDCFQLDPELIRECWLVNREDLPPVPSCIGIGDPFYYYIYFVFAFNSIVPVLLFWIALVISNQSLQSAYFTLLMFAFNQTYASRVQWAPSLRETFGYPLFLLHHLWLAQRLKYSHFDHKYPLLIIVLQLSCWQFSSFILLFQAVSVWLTLEILPSLLPSVFKFTNQTFVYRYFLLNLLAIALHSLFQFGNTFALNSFYSHTVMAYLTVTVTCRGRCPLMRSILVALLVLFIKLTTTTLLQGNVSDDFHIWSILASKVSDNYRSFHSMLYTCAKEFDFLPFADLVALTHTTLLPMATISLLFGLLFRLTEPVFCYNLLITALFTLIALLIMRLKLLLVPQLCIISGFVFSNSSTSKSRKMLKWILLAMVTFLASLTGLTRINETITTYGEFSNQPLEQVFEFISTNTSPSSNFAGKIFSGR